MLVFDASPLIVLASAERLALLETFDRTLLVPERVRSEAVDAGIAAGYADARRLEAVIEEGSLDVREVEATPLFDDLSDLDGLSEADAAVLAVAADEDATAILDEARGRSIAAAEGIQTRGTAWLVLSRVAEGHVSTEEGRAAIDDLVDAGWHCSTDLYRQILSKLEGL